MTGVGSGDAAREEADEEADVAPPERRNGAHERLGLGFGAGAGGGFGEGAGAAGAGSGGVLCRERESRRRPDCEGVGEVSPEEGRCGLCPDLRWLLRRRSRSRGGEGERERAMEAPGVVSPPDEAERLDEMAKSSSEGDGSRRRRWRE